MKRQIDSAGILFVCSNKCLLAHSTNSKRVGSWMPPKGHLEPGESPELAAIREVREEIGWTVKGIDLKDYFDVEYKDRSGRVYKLVRIFVVQIENEDPDKNGPSLSKTGTLQLDEVDETRWFNREEVRVYALPRYVEGCELFL